jgi:hypothetical protein
MKIIHTSKIIAFGFLTLLASCHAIEGTARLKSWLPFGNRAKATQEQINKAKNCPICLEDFTRNDHGEYDPNAFVVLRCNKTVPHIFHKKCLNQWVNEGHSTCPLCRTSIPKNTNAAINDNDTYGSIKDVSLLIATPVRAIWWHNLCAQNLKFSMPVSFIRNVIFLSAASLPCYYLCPQLFRLSKREDKLGMALFVTQLSYPLCALFNYHGKSLDNIASLVINRSRRFAT